MIELAKLRQWRFPVLRFFQQTCETLFGSHLSEFRQRLRVKFILRDAMKIKYNALGLAVHPCKSMGAIISIQTRYPEQSEISLKPRGEDGSVELMTLESVKVRGRLSPRPQRELQAFA